MFSQQTFCSSSRSFRLHLSRYVEHVFGHFSHVRTEVAATKGAVKVTTQIIDVNNGQHKIFIINILEYSEDLFSKNM